MTAVALGGLLGTSAGAYSAFLGGGPSPDPFVVVGGHIVPPSTTGFNIGPRDFSVDAHVEKKGTKTYGILRYGNNENANESRRLGDVLCINIQGNRAVVGGTTRGSNPAEGRSSSSTTARLADRRTKRVTFRSRPSTRPSNCPAFPGGPRAFRTPVRPSPRDRESTRTAPVTSTSSAVT